MNRYEASKIVAGNWRIWTRLPRLAKLSKVLFPRTYNTSTLEKIGLLHNIPKHK